MSYIRIQGILETQPLKDAILQAEALDRSQYGEDVLAALDELVLNAKPLFYQATTVQEDFDCAAEDITAKLEEMNGEVQTEADMTSLNLAILMAEKMEAQQAENQCYTEESWAAAAEALRKPELSEKIHRPCRKRWILLF